MTVARLPILASFRLIDILKVIAAQCIVLHHFSAYGPLSEAASSALPEVFEWLYDNARIAVQVFLVIAGYLAARSFALTKRPTADVLSAIWQRYQRLTLPFVAALLITVLCSAVARPFLEAGVVPAAPALPQLLAHASLLHSVADVESLSAGVWYVAIDFQLYATLALVLWLGGGKRWLSMALVALLCVASITCFNTDAEWDIWSVYFFGAYGLGALAWWAGQRARHGMYAVGLYATTLCIGLVALAVSFRERMALAISVSALLSSFGSSQLQFPYRPLKKCTSSASGSWISKKRVARMPSHSDC
ncbi:MAG: acyltransferase family protein [Rhodoferax sp.]|uniref:acyltransferase family protein n=1 Tax=Rhodoferax sp. TaxID=50421 RepID=UPI002ACD4D75|nr:acyltransferase family protein [Rhodoferax sp.]MDZ7892157.1 acyltransferase family protein [Rhodoferax sp.]